jgi:hypothetical protein
VKSTPQLRRILAREVPRENLVWKCNSVAFCKASQLAEMEA